MTERRMDTIHSAAVTRYWNDALFHARAATVMQEMDALGQDRLTIIHALYIDDLYQEAAAEEQETEVEWGLRNALGTVLVCSGEEAAREHAKRYGEVVTIVRRTAGPWVPVGE